MPTLLISVGVVLASILIGILLHTSNLERRFKVILLLTLISIGATSYRVSNQFYGHPLAIRSSVDRMIILAYFADLPSGRLYLWYFDPTTNQPVSISMPYDEVTEKQLSGMFEASQGQPVLGRVKVTLDATDPLSRGVEKVEIEGLPPGDGEGGDGSSGSEEERGPNGEARGRFRGKPPLDN